MDKKTIGKVIILTGSALLTYCGVFMVTFPVLSQYFTQGQGSQTEPFQKAMIVTALIVFPVHFLFALMLDTQSKHITKF